MPLNFILRRPEHAIGEFSANLIFAQNLTSAAFADVVNKLKEVSQRLNLPAPVNVQVINVGMIPGQFNPVPNGTGFQRFSPSGEIETSIVCDANEIAVTLRNYTRWHEVREMLISAFDDIGQVYLKYAPAIAAIRISYLNEFQAQKPGHQNTSELFRPSSPWLASIPMEDSEAWHCHTGKFIERSDDYRFLVNVNSDVSPQPWPANDQTRTHAKILILASCNFDKPGKGPAVVMRERLATFLGERLDAAHSLEKEILNQVMSDPYLDNMGEGARDY